MSQMLSALAVFASIAIFAAAAGAQAGPSWRHLNAPGRGHDLPFSDVVDTGDTVYLSGGLGLDPKTGQAPADVDVEIRLLLEGMKEKLSLAGLTMDDLVSVQIFATDLAHYERFNAAYKTYFKDRFPARAFIGSGPLLRGCRFEIMGIARRQGRSYIPA